MTSALQELQDQWGASRELVPGSCRGQQGSVQLALSSGGWEREAAHAGVESRGGRRPRGQRGRQRPVSYGTLRGVPCAAEAGSVVGARLNPKAYF